MYATAVGQSDDKKDHEEETETLEKLLTVLRSSPVFELACWCRLSTQTDELQSYPGWLPLSHLFSVDLSVYNNNYRVALVQNRLELSTGFLFPKAYFEIHLNQLQLTLETGRSTLCQKCSAKCEGVQLAETYNSLLRNIENHKKLVQEFKCKQKSTAEAARLVGLELPKTN
nr:unnamed protein product [Spirometra erinaceieuropaei]